MARYIIGIHGLRNKPPTDLLKKWWQFALKEGLEHIGHPHLRIPFDLIYWADELYPEPLDPDLSDPDDELYMDEPYQWGVSAIQEDRSNQVNKLRRYIEKQLHGIFLKPNLSMNYENITDKIFRHFFKDLDKYFSKADTENETTRLRVQQRMLELLDRHAKDEVLLIAHSMGSIIAYDVMTRYPERCKHIQKFVTIGSPLGLPFILGKLAQGMPETERIGDKLRTPSVFKGQWLNYSDPEDMIAFDQQLSDDYVANELGVKVEDFPVFNDYLDGGERNTHKSYGYLRSDEMATLVHEFLSPQSGRFRGMIDKIWSTFSISFKNIWRKRK